MTTIDLHARPHSHTAATSPSIKSVTDSVLVPNEAAEMITSVTHSTAVTQLSVKSQDRVETETVNLQDRDETTETLHVTSRPRRDRISDVGSSAKLN